MLKDLEDLRHVIDGVQVMIYPLPNNLRHQKPVKARYDSGYFYCEGTNLKDGPDYYWRDIFLYNKGFELVKEGKEDEKTKHKSR